MKKINTQHHTKQMKKYWIRCYIQFKPTCAFSLKHSPFLPTSLCYRRFVHYIHVCVCVCTFRFVFFEQQWKEAGNFRKEKEAH